MASRTTLVTTVVLLCHVLLVPCLVTSQALRPARPGEPGEQVIIKADEQEKKGDVFTLRREVEITFRHYVLRGDEVVYDEGSGQITATGHVTFVGGPHDEHLEASRATYNVRTDSGEFYDVVGTTGARVQGRQVILTTSNPFSFTGQRVEKRGRDLYVVHGGSVTSCRLPNPKWSFNVGRAVVQVGEDAKLYHATFRMKGIPLFYFPWVQHPVDRLGRQSGFLIPTIGQSSTKGTIIGDAYYWAINRSMDATFGGEYYTRIGWAQHGEFRARPTDTSWLDTKIFSVIDRRASITPPPPPPTIPPTPPPPPTNQGGQEVSLDGVSQFPAGFRGVAAVDYLSSFIFRVAFAETLSEAVNSEVKSVAFLSRTHNGFFVNGMGARYQNFQSTTPGDLVMILHAPSIEASSVDRNLPRTPFHWSIDFAGAGVSRSEPSQPTDFVTNLVGRFDVRPEISMPVVWHGWSFRPSASVRDTAYSQCLEFPASQNGECGGKFGVTDIGTPISRAVNRHAYEADFELRAPTLARIFDRPLFGQRLKHTIEPYANYRYVTGVNNFAEIIRFDERDILSDTNEVEYGFITRLYAKPAGSKDANASPASRDILSWQVAQKYFGDQTFGGALVEGRRNVFTTTVDLTGIAFLTEPRPFSPIISRLRLNLTRATDIQWNLDYDSKKGYINASTLLVGHRMGEWFVAGSQAFLHAPGEVIVTTPEQSPQPLNQLRFNQLRFIAGYGHPNKRGLSTAANIGWDANIHTLQYGALQTTYNWDCCGFTVEYRRFLLGNVRNESQFRFGLTLANVGTFGTLRRQERLF